jgi:histidinol-phosphate aminotransferase
LENLVVIRTFSKAWGLAGVRCGYSIASKFITELLFRVKAPYNMNKLTSNAVINAIKNKSKRDSFVDLIKKEKNRVEVNLKSNKSILSIAKSDANFISFKVDRPKEVFTHLENNGIIIRDRSNQLNFSGYLRVTIGTIEENNLFLIKLNEILK